MRRYLMFMAGIVMILALVIGCENRGSNITPVDLGDLEGWSGVDPSPSHPFVPALTLQLRNPQEILLGSAYLPPGAMDIPPTHPMPLLILLAPETGTRFYYFQAGLSELVRDLTASGQIQPMVIYCMASDQTFGGYFYGDSDPAGHYDSIFHYDLEWDNIPITSTSDLLRYLHTAYPSTIKSPAKRGIGGIGQGAYGAFRAAIKNPGVFSSISVADGPLDFDGPDGSSGLMDLFHDAVLEQEASYNANESVDTIKVASTDAFDDIWVDTIITGIDTTFDSTWVNYDTIPFNFNRHFDSAQSMPISMTFIGGSLAFSPNDSIVYSRRIDTSIVPAPGRVDTTYTRRLVFSDWEKIADSLLPGGGDSTTFIYNLIKLNPSLYNIDLDFHLPFDANGNAYQPIWDRWMANNLENMFVAEGGDPLQGANMWFATNPNAHWDYYHMTQSWMDFLRSQGHELEEYRYSSYNDDPVINDEYLFDILREMLIFHSNNFGN